jgi:hypothetical protein
VDQGLDDVLPPGTVASATMALGSGIAMRGKLFATGRANPHQVPPMFSPNIRFLLTVMLTVGHGGLKVFE